MYKNFPHLDQFIGGAQLNPVNEKLNQYLVQRSNQICLSFSYFGLWSLFDRLKSLFTHRFSRNSSTSSENQKVNLIQVSMRCDHIGSNLVHWLNGEIYGIKVFNIDPMQKYSVFSLKLENCTMFIICGPTKDFQQRKKMRTNAWAKPGWSEK